MPSRALRTSLRSANSVPSRAFPVYHSSVGFHTFLSVERSNTLVDLPAVLSDLNRAALLQYPPTAVAEL